MFDAYTRRHRDQRRIKDADQTEFEAILRGNAVVDRGIYDDRVADALDDYDPQGAQDMESWHRSDLMIDSAVGQIHEEIERRDGLLGQAYPFRLDDGLLTYEKSKSGFYEFCLAISLADQITTGEHAQLPRAFERLSTILVRSYFGEGARGLHLGTPRDADVGARFRDAMKRAHEETKEWFWGPDPGLPVEPSDTGDHGVDFVVWKAPPDSRPGSLFILGQCACGDDWASKFDDVNLDRYKKWFNLLTFVPPVRAFATPHHVSDGFLHEALKLAGLMFDRGRLTLAAETACDAEDYRSWAGRIADLTRLVVPIANAA
ncbi:MAG: hypothetical protein JO276_14560 [Sphingomonadaceae bacterium]|nr:hypothetical protein [Sphingomonadaceae bacterium]